MISKLAPSAAFIFLAAIGVLRVVPPHPVLNALHLACWVILGALLVHTLMRSGRPHRNEDALVMIGLALATILTIRFGHYECWSVFVGLCGHYKSSSSLWDVVFVNQDSFTYLADFTSTSLRPPLYGWFAQASTLFRVPTATFMEQVRALIPFESDWPAMAAHLAANPKPILLRIVHAQQVVLWAAAVFFVWAASRVIPALAVALVILGLYDGGVLTHLYFARTIEAKMLYVAALFVAAGATLLVMVRPTATRLLLASLACAAAPLIRPQGLGVGLLLAAASLRFLLSGPISRRSIASTGVALGLFVAACLLPTIVTYVARGVLQPSNIYAMSRIAFALELATVEDAEQMPDAFARRYLTRLLSLRDDGNKPTDINHSLHRNQGLAIQACIELGDQKMQEMFCANPIKDVSAAVLARHRSEYLTRIVLPALGAISKVHVGGTIWNLPTSLLLFAAALIALAFARPWIALWGTAVLLVHMSLLVMLAAFAAPHSQYLLTSEPVLLSAMALLLAVLIREKVARSDALSPRLRS